MSDPVSVTYVLISISMRYSLRGGGGWKPPLLADGARDGGHKKSGSGCGGMQGAARSWVMGCCLIGYFIEGRSGVI